MSISIDLYRNAALGNRMDGAYPLGDAPISAPSGLFIGDFESAIYEINPSAGSTHTQYLWNQYPNGDISDGTHEDNGTLTFNASDYVTGTRSLQLDMQQSPNGDNGAPYLQYYTHNGSGRWHYIREIVENFLSEGPWSLDTYNRMAFCIKTPSSLTMKEGGQFNLSVGTYTSEVAAGGPTNSDAEAGTGWHYYHRFDLAPGVWNQCFLDHHPSHSRDASGGSEQGNLPYPTGDTGYNYFDVLTRMYFDIEEGNTTAPTSTWLFDDIRFYEETAAENDSQVYSVCGSYNSGTNEIILGWNRHKDENAVVHEVRYAFSPFHDNGGWTHGSAAPSGSVTPPGFQGYNQMLYKTTAIDVTGQSTIYLAIRPVGATEFKQIPLRLDL